MGKEESQNNTSIHIPVLLQEVIEYLDPQPRDLVFDGTFGGGGYSRALISHEPTIQVIATDQDRVVVEREARDLDSRITLVHDNFSRIVDIADSHGQVSFNGIVLDLGISSDQLADRERGISFQYAEAPLDMRMNASEDNHLTAWGVINAWEEEEIADMLYLYGGERSNRKIARAIVEDRKNDSIDTVGDLLACIERVLPRRGAIHPATKTFQALRIVVNDELGNLERFLEELPHVIAPGGRVVVVTFHSLEERIVRDAMKHWKKEGSGELQTKQPVNPTREEVRRNKRSRSARLRAFKFY